MLMKLIFYIFEHLSELICFKLKILLNLFLALFSEKVIKYFSFVCTYTQMYYNQLGVSKLLFIIFNTQTLFASNVDIWYLQLQYYLAANYDSTYNDQLF